MNEITEGIKIALNNIFGEKYTVYIESIQDMKVPCFLVRPLGAIRQDLLKNRYKKSESFLIQYVPENKDSCWQECMCIGDRLLNELEFINMDFGSIGCTSKRYEITDEVLNFSMVCNRIIQKMESGEKIESININQPKMKR